MKVPAVVKGETKPSSHGDGDGDGGEREGAETAESERARRVREEEPKGCGANEHCAVVTLAPLGGFAPCTSGPPSGQNGPTRMNSRRLHASVSGNAGCDPDFAQPKPGYLPMQPTKQPWAALYKLG
jgi:hypothetical protein